LLRREIHLSQFQLLHQFSLWAHLSNYPPLDSPRNNLPMSSGTITPNSIINSSLVYRSFMRVWASKETEQMSYKKVMTPSSDSSQMSNAIVILISSKAYEESSRCCNTSLISKLASSSKNTLRTHINYRTLTTRVCSCISCSRVNPTWNSLWGTTAICYMISTAECLNISKRAWRKSSKHNSHHAPIR